jgi:toxin ParE1/3/4
MGDIAAILGRSEERFGEAARRRYQALLRAGLEDLVANPLRPESTVRPEIGPGIRSYHLRHSAVRARTEYGMVRTPRHVLFYRLVDPDLIDVARVLHDAMDPRRHVPPAYGES